MIACINASRCLGTRVWNVRYKRTPTAWMGLSRFLTVLGTEMDILDCGGRRAPGLFPVVLYGGRQAAARRTRGRRRDAGYGMHGQPQGRPKHVDLSILSVSRLLFSGDILPCVVARFHTVIQVIVVLRLGLRLRLRLCNCIRVQARTPFVSGATPIPVILTCLSSWMWNKGMQSSGLSQPLHRKPA